MSKLVNLLSPKFKGKRFESHTLPIEFLDDLVALSELIKELAKQEYLKDNSNRKRIPRGFFDEISIKLKNLEEGSTITNIVADIKNPDLFGGAHLSYFKTATNYISDAICHVSDENYVLEKIPPNLLYLFNRIGNHLRKEESIWFESNGKGYDVELDTIKRKKLIQISNKEKEYSYEYEIRGYINEMDKSNNSFEITPIYGAKVSGKFDRVFKEDIQEAFNKYDLKQKVLLQGIGTFNYLDKLIKIESISNMEFLDELDISSQLEEFKTLNDGWYNGVGKAPDKEKLDILSEEFNKYYNPENELPYLYPTPEGNVQAEWECKDSNIQYILEIQLDDELNSELYILDLKNENKDKNYSLKLTQSTSWESLNKKLNL